MRRLLEDIGNSLLGMMAVDDRRAGRLTAASIRVLDLSATECVGVVRIGEAEFVISLPVASDGGLIFEPLIDDPHGLVWRRDDPLAEITDPNWADLAGLRLVTVHMGSSNRTTLDAELGWVGIHSR